MANMKKTQASTGKMIDREKKIRRFKKPLGGKMKKPKPGSYDYQLQETMKPKYKGMLKGGQSKIAKNKSTIDPRIDKKDPLADFKASERRKKKLKEQGSFMMGGKVMKTTGRMLSGGQIKIAKKAPPFNKIDEKDFAVLRAEKAKGRQQGLQDEKMKPGRTMRAALGAMALGLTAKKKMKNKKMAPVAMGGIGAAMAKQMAIKKILGRNKGGMNKANRPGKIKLTGLGSPLERAGRTGADYKKYLEGLKAATAQKSMKRVGSKVITEAAKAAKATRIGKIAAGVAGAALLAKAGLEKLYEKRTGKKPFTKRPKKSVMEGDLEGSTKPYKVNKKMGGGMMKRPMGYDKGGDSFVKRRMKLGRVGIPLMVGVGLLKVGKKLKDKIKSKKKMGGGLMEATQRLRAQGKMGGGMMQRPMMAKMGRSVREAEGRARKKRKKESPVAPTPRLQNKPKGLGGVGPIPRRMRGPIAPVSPRLAGPQMSMGGMMPGYKKGKSVMAKGCKLGRKRPTKMFT